MLKCITSVAGASILAVAGAASIAAAPGSKTLHWDADIDAPPSVVWKALTTEEGIESWMVPVAEMDLKLGGLLQTNYDPNAAIGDPGTITHRILSYEPERMLSMELVLTENCPPKAHDLQGTWGIMHLVPIENGRTKFMLTSAGWGQGPKWDELEAFFQEGNRWTLEQLQNMYDPIRVLGRLVGGEWIYEGAGPDGASEFRARGSWRHGPGNKSIVADGWIKGEEGMMYHGAHQLFRDPADGAVHFQNINESGTIARGVVRCVDVDRVEYDWNAMTPDGELTRYLIEIHLTSDDTYDFRVSHYEDDGSLTNLVDIEYTRVDEAPARFTSVATKTH